MDIALLCIADQLREIASATERGDVPEVLRLTGRLAEEAGKHAKYIEATERHMQQQGEEIARLQRMAGIEYKEAV